jgi:hypothetical protein
VPLPTENLTPFKDFLDDLEEERRESFLKSLSDTEIMRASASEEEFRMITGHESVPENFFEDRPLKANDVTPQFGHEHEDFQEMFENFEKNFPPENSIDRLRQKANEFAAPAPAVNVTISINELREKSHESNESS